MLLRKLYERYDAPVPANLTPEEVMMWKAAILDKIQIRVRGEHATCDAGSSPSINIPLVL